MAVREGARRMLAVALGVEVSQNIAELAAETDGAGRRRRFCRGHGPARERQEGGCGHRRADAVLPVDSAAVVPQVTQISEVLPLVDLHDFALLSPDVDGRAAGRRQGTDRAGRGGCGSGPTCCAVTAPHLMALTLALALVRADAGFDNGYLVERPEAPPQRDAPQSPANPDSCSWNSAGDATLLCRA